MFILKKQKFKYNDKHTSYDLDNFELLHPSFFIIRFLNYVGIKEIYLFGYYLADEMINDLTNYNFYNDIVCKQFHTYDVPFTRIKEPQIFKQHVASTRLAKHCIQNNIKLYNVSEYGCLSNKIKRINFESVFLNDKNIISSKISYIDFLDTFNHTVDIDFYYEKYCNNNSNMLLINKKIKVLEHLLSLGIYVLNKVNKYDTKNNVCLNPFIIDIMSLFAYLYDHHNNITSFFAHSLLTFNKVFNVCFYNDFDKISCPNFYDELVSLHINKINNNIINLDAVFYSHFNKREYNENKYFKLFIYLIYYKNIPDDFNPSTYIELNEDLKYMTEIEAINHYISYGCFEKRIYTRKININENLKRMIEIEEAMNHYDYYSDYDSDGSLDK